MATILPIQSVFDKDIPEESGNGEYRQERELLIMIDTLITQSNLEDPVITHFLEAASAKKKQADKSETLTNTEHDNACSHAVMALRMAILRKRLRLSLRKFSLALSHSDLYKWFCGINRFGLPQVPGKSMVGELENSMTPELLEEVEQKLFQALQQEGSQLLHDPLDFSQSYFDCTCISANIHYPVDWLLLRDATRTLMKATARIRELDLCHRMPCEPAGFITKMNVLSMEMTFAKRKKGAKKLRKGVLRKMKKLMKRVAKHAMSHLKLLEEKWETVEISRSQTEQIIKQIKNIKDQLDNVVKNAHERIIGERQVANKDKILSLYEKDVNMTVRKKVGAEVEFGNTLYLAEQIDGMIMDWKFYREQAPADTKMLKESHKRIKNRVGVKVQLMAGDRGFDSEANQKHMESNDIFNAVCPRNPILLAQRLQEDKFREAQNRRSQTEARIAILSHCFCGATMKQKGFDHRHIHMGMSILSHNLWVLGRLKIKQEKESQQAA
ncbi:MAG: hypothetical protein GY799_29260 [Desulfobulbaceae bacterium]|nr:hypothetical protein [Desulfobulbaceae bacterium]